MTELTAQQAADQLMTAMVSSRPGDWEAACTVHAIYALLAERRELLARQVSEWLPIESAPKDELILVGPTKRMGICAAMLHSRDGWVTETCSEWVNIYTPTHWMPLPAPPYPTATQPTQPTGTPGTGLQPPPASES